MKRRTDTSAPGADQPDQVDQAEQGAASPALDADTLADLSAIAGEAATVDGGALPPGAVEAGPALSTGEQLSMMLKAARKGVVPLARRRLPGTAFEEIWSESQLEEIGQAWGIVFDVNGWTLGGVMDKWGPYVLAAVATAPPVYATYELVQEVKAQAAAAERQARNGGQMSAQQVPA
jgi:hypothetical protein